jgi:hypothetical protein
VVAVDRSTDADTQSQLLALSSSGAVIWTREQLRPDAEWFRIRDLALGPAGASVLVAGLVVEQPDGRGQAWIAELELEDGAMIRARSYADPTISLRPSAIAATESGVVLAGSAGTQAWLVRLDAELEPIWERRFEFEAGPARGVRVIPLREDRIAVAGIGRSPAAPGIDGEPPTDVFVRVYDSSGALEFEFTPADLALPHRGLADAVAHAGGLLVGGSRGQVFPTSELWAIDETGRPRVIWDPPDPSRLVEALATRDDAVFAAGSKDQAHGPAARWLGRLQPDLRSYAWEHIGPPGQISAIAAAITEPAIYAAILIPRPSGGSDAAICKFSE